MENLYDPYLPISWQMPSHRFGFDSASIFEAEQKLIRSYREITKRFVEKSRRRKNRTLKF